jgi:hypothetical protein
MSEPDVEQQQYGHAKNGACRLGSLGRELHIFTRPAIERTLGQYEAAIADADRVGDVPAGRYKQVEQSGTVDGVPDPSASALAIQVAGANQYAGVIQRAIGDLGVSSARREAVPMNA